MYVTVTMSSCRRPDPATRSSGRPDLLRTGGPDYQHQHRRDQQRELPPLSYYYQLTRREPNTADQVDDVNSWIPAGATV